MSTAKSMQENVSQRAYRATIAEPEDQVPQGRQCSERPTGTSLAGGRHQPGADHGAPELSDCDAAPFPV
eukprot:9425530-Pyramimonas_sp.AAC.1